MKTHLAFAESPVTQRPRCGALSVEGGWTFSPLTEKAAEVTCLKCLAFLRFVDVAQRPDADDVNVRKATLTRQLEGWVDWVENAAVKRAAIYTRGIEVALAHPMLPDNAHLIDRLLDAIDLANSGNTYKTQTKQDAKKVEFRRVRALLKAKKAELAAANGEDLRGSAAARGPSLET